MGRGQPRDRAEDIDELVAKMSDCRPMHPAMTRQYLRNYAAVLRERDELERQLNRAMPAWRNLRDSLNWIAHLLRHSDSD